MARREVRERQFSLYFKSAEQKKQFIKLAKSHGLTLSHLTLLALEQFIEPPPSPAPSENTATIKALQLEHSKLFSQVLKLDQENKLLKAQLAAKDMVFRNINIDVVNLFRYGTKEGTKEHYTSDDVKEAAGLYKSRLDPKVRQQILQSVDYTLAQLELVGFIKKDWRGWKWYI